MTPASPRDLPKPHGLELRLAANFHSSAFGEAELGWTRWHGTVRASWWADNLTNSGLAALDGVAEPDDEELVARVGDLTIATYAAPGGLDLEQLVDHADAWAADAVNAIEPLLTHESRLEELVGAAYEFTNVAYVKTAELDERWRGRGLGIGAWAVARALLVLAPNAETLVVADPAPLSPRHAGIDAEDRVTGRRREFTPVEQQVWHQAEQRLAEHWKTTLGLTQLATDVRTLVGEGGPNAALRQSIDRWTNGAI